MKVTELTGEQIKELRKKLGLKQKDCAHAVGVDIRTWQKYEDDTHNCKQIYIDVIKNYRL